MPVIKIYLTIIFTLVQSTFVICQELEGINGRIVDNNKKPLPYATIRLKNLSLGVVSNQNGDFRLPFKQQLFQDTLIVSYIGYATKKLPVSELKLEGINVIGLKESATQMAELEIHSKRKGRLTAKRIVAAAISNITINYPTHPFTYVAYYRDYQIKEKSYTNLNEAIVRVMDCGFNSNDQIETKVELMQYRVNKEFPIDTLSSKPYDNREKKFIPQAVVGSFGGNELSILKVHDALRNYKNYSYSFVDVFSEKFIDNHGFRLLGLVNYNNIQLYEIEFKSNTIVSGDSHLGKGKIYVEKQTYKIHKMEYSMYDKSKIDKLIYNIKVEYGENSGEMYLNYISFNNEFNMRNPDDFRVLDTRIRSDVSAFTILFSHAPDTVSATNKNNYHFTIRGKKVELDTILFSPNREGKEVIAVIKNRRDHIFFANSKLAKQMTVDYSNIRDMRNRIVNRMTFIHGTQYREIFVQKIEPEAASHAAVLGIDKFTPLGKASVTHNMQNFEDYWMNTPLKSDISEPLKN